MNKKKSAIGLLLYKNLAAEMAAYGEKLTLKKLMVEYFKMTVICLITGYIYRLPLWGYAIIIAVALLFVPFIMLNNVKSMYETKRYHDVMRYYEKMLANFRHEQKIYTALIETEKLFPEGEMKQVIQAAIDYIESTNETGRIEEKALQLIEDAYPVERIRYMHRFLIQTDYQGGNPAMGVEVLTMDKNMLDRRIQEFQQKIKMSRTVNKVGIILTLILCALLTNIDTFIPQIQDYINISSNIIAQVTAVMLIVFMLWFYKNLTKKMIINWIGEDSSASDEKWEQTYNKYVYYDMNKQRTKSIIYAFIVFLITVILYCITKSKPLLVIGFGISIVAAMLYKLAYMALSRRVIREIKAAFPLWLIQISLLLQYENVQMAIAKSYETAPGILKIPIREMLQKLDINPDDAEPFKEFLNGIEGAGDVTEAVITLYTISQRREDTAEEQFKELIIKNLQFTNLTEKAKNDDTVTLYKQMIFSPTLAGSLKMIVDGIILMLSFMNITNTFM